jgi:hypothetical protein
MYPEGGQTTNAVVPVEGKERILRPFLVMRETEASSPSP